MWRKWRRLPRADHGQLGRSEWTQILFYMFYSVRLPKCPTPKLCWRTNFSSVPKFAKFEPVQSKFSLFILSPDGRKWWDEHSFQRGGRRSVRDRPKSNYRKYSWKSRGLSIQLGSKLYIFQSKLVKIHYFATNIWKATNGVAKMNLKQ